MSKSNRKDTAEHGEEVCKKPEMVILQYHESDKMKYLCAKQTSLGEDTMKGMRIINRTRSTLWKLTAYIVIQQMCLGNKIRGIILKMMECICEGNENRKNSCNVHFIKIT